MKIGIYDIILKAYIEIMSWNFAKILTETGADRIVGDFVLHFSILLFSKFSGTKLL